MLLDQVPILKSTYLSNNANWAIANSIQIRCKFCGKTHDTNSSKSNKAQQTPGKKTNFHCLLCVFLFHVLVFYFFFFFKKSLFFYMCLDSKLKWMSISRKKILNEKRLLNDSMHCLWFLWWHFACSRFYFVYAIKLKSVLNVSYPFIEHVTHFETDTFSQEFKSCNILQKLRKKNTTNKI